MFNFFHIHSHTFWKHFRGRYLPLQPAGFTLYWSSLNCVSTILRATVLSINSSASILFLIGKVITGFSQSHHKLASSLSRLQHRTRYCWFTINTFMRVTPISDFQHRLNLTFQPTTASGICFNQCPYNESILPGKHQWLLSRWPCWQLRYHNTWPYHGYCYKRVC